MKTRTKNTPVFLFGSICISVILSLILISEVGAAPQSIFLECADLDNSPFVMDSSNKIRTKNPGITIELLRMVEKKLPVRFVIKRVPWVRAQHSLEKNLTDGIFHSSFQADRMKIGVYPMKNGQVDPSRKIAVRNYVFYTTKGSTLYWDGKTLRGVNDSIGIVRGAAIGKYLLKMNIPTEEITSPEQEMKMLAAGRLAAVAELENIGDAVVTKSPDEFSKIIKVSTPIQEYPYYLMFSHQFYNQYPDLTEKIWNEIRKIVSSEQYMELVARYLK